jgi:hypothetical protein
MTHDRGAIAAQGSASAKHQPGDAWHCRVGRFLGGSRSDGNADVRSACVMREFLPRHLQQMIAHPFVRGGTLLLLGSLLFSFTSHCCESACWYLCWYQ